MLQTTDIHKQKAVLIEDICRTGRLLNAYSNDFKRFLSPSVKLINELLDMSILELEGLQLTLQVEANTHIYKAIALNCGVMRGI